MTTSGTTATFGAPGDLQSTQRVIDDPVVIAIPVQRRWWGLRFIVPMLLVGTALIQAGRSGLGVTLAGVLLGTACLVATNLMLDSRSRVRLGPWSGYLVATSTHVLVVHGTFSTGRPVEVTDRFALADVAVQPKAFGLVLTLPGGRRTRLSVPRISFGLKRAAAVAELAARAGA